MPKRMPVIPGFTGSIQLLRSVQDHELDKQRPRDNNSSSSGVHSNSSDNCDTFERRKLALQRRNMGRTGSNGHDVTSSSGGDDDVSDDDMYSDNQEEDSDGDTDNSSEQDDRMILYEQERMIASKLNGNANEAFLAAKLDRANGSKGYDQRSSGVRGARQSTGRRLSGPQSYIRTTEHDEEIEIIHRKDQVRLRHPEGSHKRTSEYQAKRRSDTAIEYMMQRRNQLNELKKRSESNDKRAAPVQIRRQRSASGAKDFKHGRNTGHPREQQALVSALKAKFHSPADQSKSPQTVSVKDLRKGRHDSTDMDMDLYHKSGSRDNLNNFEYEKVKSLERKAKRRTKALKQNIMDAKMDVKEAQLGEFAVKLRTRHAQIEERHAKLCRKRMALKKAQEDLDALEANLDGEEEELRARERKIKNRERRVKQEEAGLKLKEESLRKRETTISENISVLERRRQIVEEKEDTATRMNDIIAQREYLHGQSIKKEEQKAKSRRSGLGKLITRKNKDKNQKPGQDRSTKKMAPPPTTSPSSSNTNTLPKNSQFKQTKAPLTPTNDQNKYHTLDRNYGQSPKKQNSVQQKKLPQENKGNNNKQNVMGWWI